MTEQKKIVLGRGLSALIQNHSQKEVNIKETASHKDTGESGIIASIDMHKIKPNPFQPRTHFDADALSELTKSIIEKGVIQPITVRRYNGEYQLISGERRLRASQEAKLKHIPAYIMDVKSDEDMLELALIENIQREYLNPLEIANAYQKLISECKLSVDDIAKRVGKDRSTIANFLRLLKLPQKIQEALRKDKISMGHARALISLPNERMQLKFYDKIIDGGLSVRKVEEMVRNTQHSEKKSHTKVINISSNSNIHGLENQLRQALGTKVTVKSKGSNKGEIIIEYYSLDDFDRLMDIFTEK